MKETETDRNTDKAMETEEKKLKEKNASIKLFRSASLNTKRAEGGWKRKRKKEKK